MENIQTEKQELTAFELWLRLQLHISQEANRISAIADEHDISRDWYATMGDVITLLESPKTFETAVREY